MTRNESFAGRGPLPSAAPSTAARLAAALLLAGALPAAATPAVEDVVRLGADNGLALACGATEISARARRLMVDHAPRTSEYGTAFEQATQQAFGAQLKSKAACPAPGEFALRVEQHAAALRDTPDAAPQPAQDGAINPRYLMIDTHGAMVSNEDFAGRYQLLTFGYTSCPDVCPTTLANMVQIRKRLGAQGERLQLVFITLDPERDDPRTLDKYTSYFDNGIVALSGSAELTHAIADHFQVKYRKFAAPGAGAGAGAGGYSVDHTAGLYLLGTDGAFIARFAYDSAATDTAARIAALMQPPAATQ